MPRRKYRPTGGNFNAWRTPLTDNRQPIPSVHRPLPAAYAILDARGNVLAEVPQAHAHRAWELLLDLPGAVSKVDRDDHSRVFASRTRMRAPVYEDAAVRSEQHAGKARGCG